MMNKNIICARARERVVYVEICIFAHLCSLPTRPSGIQLSTLNNAAECVANYHVFNSSRFAGSARLDGGRFCHSDFWQNIRG